MKEQLISEIQRKMLPYLNNEQLMHLRGALSETLQGATVSFDGAIENDARDAVEAFISAKRIEGCSEKTLNYYRKTIESMTSRIGKNAQQITTDELRKYLTNYQVQRGSSKVTIDNIRRIFHKVRSLGQFREDKFRIRQGLLKIDRILTVSVKSADLLKQNFNCHAFIPSVPNLIRSSLTILASLTI